MYGSTLGVGKLGVGDILLQMLFPFVCGQHSRFMLAITIATLICAFPVSYQAGGPDRRSPAKTRVSPPNIFTPEFCEVLSVLC